MKVSYWRTTSIHILDPTSAHPVNVARSELTRVDRLLRASNATSPRIATLKRRAEDDRKIENSEPSNYPVHETHALPSEHGHSYPNADITHPRAALLRASASPRNTTRSLNG